jgi:hypothetical protein
MELTEAMADAMVPMSEGHCPLCLARLVPHERREGVSIAGSCPRCGLFELAEDIWYHTAPGHY